MIDLVKLEANESIDLVSVLLKIPLHEWVENEHDLKTTYTIIKNDIEIELTPRNNAWRPYLTIKDIQIVDKGEAIDELAYNVVQYYIAKKQDKRKFSQEEADLKIKEAIAKIKECE